jgi:spore coat protein CotH
MAVSGGTATATIPGQVAGSLVRYRLDSGNEAGVGTWPRQGDGSVYAGTTVARPATSQLPTFELFMDDATYTAMFNDLTLTGDDGYPMTFAFDGQVFDNAKIRVKGQVSRTFPKKKFKIVLPAGHVLEHELFPEPVDEFAVHSSWIDRSFLRETLASEFMQSADVRGTQQAFPIRIERNGGFYGLYTYVEQPDGTWRDRWALDDSEVYEVSPDMIWGLLSPTDVTRSQASLRARYDKETFEYLGDQRLRDLIWVVNQLSGAAEREWLFANADVASMVNAIAASMVMQNQDWGHKNYRLVFDQYGRVGITTNDYDLTFGRRWSMELGPYDTRVYTGGWFEQPGGPLFETFFYDPVLAEMVKRRIRTLAEEEFQPDALAARVNELAASVRPDALSDRYVWGTYGGSADPTAEATRIIESFARPQYARLLGTLANAGRVARTSQPAIPAVAISQVRYDPVEHVALMNHSGDSVDLSGFEIPELDLRIPGGTVLLPGQQVVFVHEDVDRLAERYPGLLLGGVFDTPLTDAPHGFTLVNRQGAVVARHTLTAPRQLTEFSADAGRSALVSLVATETAGPGFLQVLDCTAVPATTSNLNVDGPWQTRAVLALTRFDPAGKACVYNHSATHIVADLQGYLAAGAVDDIDDQRLIDTRSGPRPAAGAIVRVGGGRPEATGIVSLVATETDDAGYFSVVDCASPPAVPTTSNLNYDRPGKTVASLTFARFDSSGTFCVYVRSPAHLVADLQGYLAAGAFDDVPDSRLVDTRSDGTPLTQQTIQVSGRAGATGVVSIVATETTGPGWLQVLPCGTTPGATSNLNFDAPWVTVNGLATIQFDATGSACIYTMTPTRIVVDLQGYFTAGSFEDVPDRRLLDTRNR